jgi:hypothetical protein
MPKVNITIYVRVPSIRLSMTLNSQNIGDKNLSHLRIRSAGRMQCLSHRPGKQCVPLNASLVLTLNPPTTRVFEIRVLRRVFGPKRDEVTGEWRKLHHDELTDLYSLLNIVRVVKSRRMR